MLELEETMMTLVDTEDRGEDDIDAMFLASCLTCFKIQTFGSFYNELMRDFLTSLRVVNDP